MTTTPITLRRLVELFHSPDPETAALARECAKLLKINVELLDEIEEHKLRYGLLEQRYEDEKEPRYQ